MTDLKAYNEITSAIRRAEYVDSNYADSVDIWALKACERLLREQLETVKAAGKTIYTEGDKITSLDELTKQEFIYANGKLTHRGWFLSWQIQMTILMIQRGALHYAAKTYSINREGEGRKYEL